MKRWSGRGEGRRALDFRTNWRPLNLHPVGLLSLKDVCCSSMIKWWMKQESEWIELICRKNWMNFCFHFFSLRILYSSFGSFPILFSCSLVLPPLSQCMLTAVKCLKGQQEKLMRSGLLSWRALALKGVMASAVFWLTLRRVYTPFTWRLVSQLGGTLETRLSNK